MPAKSLDAGSIWKALSKIDCTGKTMDKGGLTYLPWNQAVTYMMDHYPEYMVKWHGTTDENNVTRDVTYYEGGTAMVNCTVTIGEVKRECWLPVMDYRNKAIAHPSSRDISDAKQRCLVKCFALFGLGIYIYRGDAVPDVEDSKKTSKPRATKRSPKKAVEEAQEDPSSLTYEDASVDGWIIDLKETVTDLHNRGWTPADDLAKKQITDAIKNRDGEALVRLRKEILILADSALKLHDAEEEKQDD